MGRTFARGKRAWGICARSGQKMLLRDMVWDGQYPNLLVHPAWYEPKHPQEMLPAIEDPIALANPSPETIAPPSVPIVTLVVESANEIDVTWTPAETGITNIEEYIIYRNTNGGAYAPLETCVLVKDFLGGIIGITNATFPEYPEIPNDPWANVPPDQPATFRDLTVVQGNNYCYMVEAIPQGNNQYTAQGPPITSAAVCATVTIPAPVLTGAYDFVDDAADIAWSLPPSWAAVVQHYEIYKQINGGAFSLLTTVTGAVTTYADTTANDIDNLYGYYVVAQFAGGNSPNSNIVTEPTVVRTVYTVSGSFDPTQYPNLHLVNVKAIGAGGGAQGGEANAGNNTQYGASGGGSGGGYASCDIPAAAFVGSGVIPVEVGSGGTGGISQTAANGGVVTQSQGTDGSPSSFNTTWVVANGGVCTDTVTPIPGGTATVSGAIGAFNVYTEQGGNAGTATFGTVIDFQRNGGNTSLAGAGGAGGQGPFSNAAFPGGNAPGFVQNGGASSNGTGGIGDPGAGNSLSTTAQTAGPGGNGVSTSNFTGGGGGGGGGCAYAGSAINAACTAGAGGNGGSWGAGGGGGGAGLNGAGGDFQPCTAVGGAGGNGYQGFVIVTVYA